MGSFFASIAVRWWLRRFWDWSGQLAGWLGGLLSLYSLMPPEMQQTAIVILTGKWEQITLASAGGFIVWAFSQWRSFKATVTPQIVTRDGQQVPLEAVAQKNAVEEFAISALGQQKDTLIGRMLKLKWGQKS